MTEVRFGSVIAAVDHELVERKGLGHPDTLCDLIAERLSALYSQYCVNRYAGRVAHHWFDKVLLRGGTASMGFGHGVLTEPYKVFLFGKAARNVGQDSIPIEKIFRQACEDVLTSTLFQFNCEDWLECADYSNAGCGPQNSTGRYSPAGSEDLYGPEQFESLVSNDGNLLVGFAPLTTLEQATLAIDARLQSSDARVARPYLGRDIKIFATRGGNVSDIQVRLPFIALETPSFAFYRERIEEIETELNELCAAILGFNGRVEVNSRDAPDVAYLTVTGSVADTGDVGVVGRGNRMNGLITPMRPQSIEAVSGKNPIDHTGKLYSLLAQNIAKAVYQSAGVAAEVHVRALKHEPVKHPRLVIVRSERDLTTAEKTLVEATVRDQIIGLPSYFGQFVRSEVRTC